MALGSGRAWVSLCPNACLQHESFGYLRWCESLRVAWDSAGSISLDTAECSCYFLWWWLLPLLECLLFHTFFLVEPYRALCLRLGYTVWGRKSWPSAECKIDHPLPLGRFLSWGHSSRSSLLGPCSVLPGIVCGWDSR